MAQRLTRREIDWLQSLDDSQLLTWFLDLFRQNPVAAIDARVSLEMTLPAGVMDGWTKEQIAAFFGVRTETIDGWTRNGMPIQRRGRKPGGVGRHQRTAFNLQECAEWLAEQRTRNISADAESEKLAVADVAYREEKAKTQALRRRQLEGSLIDINVFDERLKAALESIRKGVESLHRSFGDEVAEAYTRLVDEVEAQILGGDDSDE